MLEYDCNLTEKLRQEDWELKVIWQKIPSQKKKKKVYQAYSLEI